MNPILETKTNEKKSHSTLNRQEEASRQNRLIHVLRRRKALSSVGAKTKVYGRATEFQSLQQAFDRLASTEKNDASAELIVVRGPSGSGKSSLVSSFVEWCRSERSTLNVCVGRGKYDQLVSNEPFAAIVDASNQFCHQVDQQGVETVSNFKNTLCELAGNQENTQMLGNAIPALKPFLLGKEPLATSQQFVSTSQAFTRFKQLWRLFLRSVAAVVDVTVLFLDDLQWADSNSLDLINSLTPVESLRGSRVLVICGYRDNEDIAKRDAIHWCLALQPDHKTTVPSDYEESVALSPAKSFNVERIPTTIVDLQHLSQEGMQALVTGILYGTSEILPSLEPLSDVIHRHTEGNPFFALHFLDYLSTQELLRTIDGGETWDWNLDMICNQKDAPSNIADLLGKIISMIPEKVRKTLMTAAHIGHKFSATILEQPGLAVTEVNWDSAALETPHRTSNPLIRERVRTTMAAAVDEGLLERQGHLYAFPHDQIQKAFYSLLGDRPREQAMLHFKIGEALLLGVEQDKTITTEHSVERDFFMAVDNLNLGSDWMNDMDTRLSSLELVKLNYKAARLALRKSAFVGGLQYARTGIALLDDDRWGAHYELCLDLYSLAARLEYCTGNFVRSNMLIAEIKTHGRKVMEQMPAFFTEIDSLLSRGDLRAARRLGIKVVRQLGEPMPLRPSLLHVLSELRQATQAMKKIEDNGFLNIPPLKEPKKMAAMTVLSSVALAAWLLGTKYTNSHLVAALRTVKLSAKHGLSAFTPFGIGIYASVQVKLGAYEEARRAAELSFQLLGYIEGAQVLSARTWVPVGCMVSPWTGMSLGEAQKDCLRSYHVGLAHGDMDYAFFGMVNYCGFNLWRGVRLHEVDADCRKFLAEMEEFQTNVAKWILTAFWTVPRALLGHRDRSGDDDVLVSEMKAQKIPEMVSLADAGTEVLIRVLLGTIGGNTLRQDEKLVAQIGSTSNTVHTHFSRFFFTLWFGMGSFELLRQTGKRVHKRNARRALKEARSWYNDEIVSAIPLFWFLTAELKSLSKRKEDRKAAEAAYLEAIDAATGPAECLMIAAYSYERLACIQEECLQTTSTYKQKAIRLYSKWGARAKVELLACKWSKAAEP